MPTAGGLANKDVPTFAEELFEEFMAGALVVATVSVAVVAAAAAAKRSPKLVLGIAALPDAGKGVDAARGRADDVDGRRLASAGRSLELDKS